MRRLRVNVPAVVHQTIDSETVIINLERGVYYSLDRVGVDVWAGIDAGMDREGVLALVSRRWSGDPDRMRDGVLGLIEEMKTEVLIVEDATGTCNASTSTTRSSTGALGSTATIGRATRCCSTAEPPRSTRCVPPAWTACCSRAPRW